VAARAIGIIRVICDRHGYKSCFEDLWGRHKRDSERRRSTVQEANRDLSLFSSSYTCYATRRYNTGYFSAPVNYQRSNRCIRNKPPCLISIRISSQANFLGLCLIQHRCTVEVISSINL
jgi:hypothetical protein